ncbi:MAG: GGDEF domain-containing protein [Myxococcales bacterium]|nr:GGDEF domain-containing protein [Myxococcales bacterium]
MRWDRSNPLSWSIPDRCYAIALLMIASTVILGASCLAGGWPFLAYPAERYPLLLPAQGIALACWSALAVGARLRRGREGSGRGLAIATTALYAITLAAFTLVTGPFASPGWISYLGGAVVGYVMFPRWVVLAGMILYVVLVAAGALSHSTALAPAELYEGLDGPMVLRRCVASLALFALTFSVIAWIADRWRDREARYQKLASIDSLTGLVNRRRFFKQATQELARARRYGSPVAIVLVDLDHFKRINDEHGHPVGDQALAHAAGVLAREVRDLDIVARYGGEEFAMLLPMTTATGAKEVAERCTQKLAATPLAIDGRAPIRITASMGLTCAEQSSTDTLEALLTAADAALYRAKEGGRNRVEVAPAPPQAMLPS